jgi:hypothetical protein
MFKKAMMISFVAISVVLIFRTEAKAQNLWNVEFRWCDETGSCSIHCEDILKALAKTQAPFTLVKCDALVTAITYDCRTKSGGGTQSSSHIFLPQSVDVSATTVASECTPDTKEKGKWACLEVIEDADIQDALEKSGFALCPNANFTVELIAVTNMDAKVTVFSCTDAAGNACQPDSSSTCQCTTVHDTFCADKCTLQAVPGPYTCTEVPVNTSTNLCPFE